MRNIYILVAWAFTVSLSFPQNLKLNNTFTNFRIYPSNVTQTEIVAANHPFEENTLFVTANTITLPSFFVSEGIYVTTTGGDNWYGSDTCNGPNIAFHYGDPGITIDKNGTFIMTRLGRIPFSGIYSHYSTDKGLTWSPQYTITQAEAIERAPMGSDNHYLSPYFGRSYAIWVNYSAPYPMVLSKTDNGGATWTSPATINTPPRRCEGGDLSMGLNSTVLACWAGIMNTSPFTEVHIGFGSSSNGGDSWTINEIAFETNGIKGLLPGKQNIRVNGMPKLAVDTTGGPRNGWIYIITTQKNKLPAGNDPDIILNRSSDGGMNWSSGIRVNQDDLNNGKVQYFPAAHVDIYGGLNVIYYDDRNTTSDSSGVFLSRSTDGGDTWSEFEISDHNFKPTPIGGLGQGYQGDNIALTSIGNTLWPLWMDNSSGIYQLWAAKIDLQLVDVKDYTKLPQDYKLLQNYPNPFNPSTVIEFNIPEYSWVQIKVSDLNGSETAILENKELAPGSYKLNFKAEDYNLSSGVYFITLTAGNYRETIKAVYLK